MAEPMPHPLSRTMPEPLPEPLTGPVRASVGDAVPDRVLVIACGALAREITALKRAHGWSHLDLQCLDARLHNRPELIPERLRAKIRAAREAVPDQTRDGLAGRSRPGYTHIFAAYADCGTGGGIDRVLVEEGVERLPGAHCYEFFAGRARFGALAAAEPGTFYLTDFLARHFERLVIRPLGLDRHPELRDAYFGHYRKLTYLSQAATPALLTAARAAADRLGLAFDHIDTGYGELEAVLQSNIPIRIRDQEDAHLLA